MILAEKRCMEADKEQYIPTPREPTVLMAYVETHKDLLCVYHDLLEASQHPCADLELDEYTCSIFRKLWVSGILPCLETLKYLLPRSLEFMLSFIYWAYSMITSLYPTPRASEVTCCEYLGLLAYYRMETTQYQIQESDDWCSIARTWFGKAVDKSPGIGQLYHGLSLSNPSNSLQRLTLYCKSLVCLEPFIGARSSILELCQHALQGNAPRRRREIEDTFIKFHASLFVHRQPTDEVWQIVGDTPNSLLNSYTSGFGEQGVSIALTNIAAFFEYGEARSVFRRQYLRVWAQKLGDLEFFGETATAQDSCHDEPEALLAYRDNEFAHVPTDSEAVSSMELINLASKITFSFLHTVLQTEGNKHSLPSIHVTLCFIWSISSIASPASAAWRAHCYSIRAPCT